MLPAKPRRASLHPHSVRYRMPDSLSANPAAKLLAGTETRPRQNAFRVKLAIYKCRCEISGLGFRRGREMVVKTLVGLSLVISASIDTQIRDRLGATGTESAVHMSIQRKNAALRP